MVGASDSTEFLVVIPLISDNYCHFFGIPFDERWCDLGIVFSGRRYVNIEGGVRSGID